MVPTLPDEKELANTFQICYIIDTQNEQPPVVSQGYMGVDQLMTAKATKTSLKVQGGFCYVICKQC